MARPDAHVQRFAAGPDLLAACEQGVSRESGPLGRMHPACLMVVDVLLDRQGLTRSQIVKVAIGELVDVSFPPAQLVRFDHHLAHAATAYSPPLRSRGHRCLRSPGAETSVWMGEGTGLSTSQLAVDRSGFASTPGGRRHRDGQRGGDAAGGARQTASGLS